MEGQTLARVLIDNSQYADPASFRQSLCDEIHVSALVGAGCRTLSGSLPLGPFLPLLHSRDQPLLHVEPIDPFGVDFPGFALQQYCEPPITVVHPAAGQLP